MTTVDVLITGPDLQTHSATIHSLLPAGTQTRPGALRAVNLSPEKARGLRESLCSYALDVLIVPHDFSVHDIRLATFDMDGTLIENECIDDIAHQMGRGDAVADITARAMRGELDFKASLIERVKVLKGARAEHIEEAVRGMRLQPGAKRLADFLLTHGVKCYIISGGFTEFTLRVAEWLNFDGALSNELVYDSFGRLTGEVKGPAQGELIDADGKRRTLEVLAQLHGLTLAQTLAAGDGANDQQMLHAAAYGVAYHAKPSAQAVADGIITHSGLDVIPLLFRESW